MSTRAILHSLATAVAMSGDQADALVSSYAQGRRDERARIAPAVAKLRQFADELDTMPMGSILSPILRDVIVELEGGKSK